VIKILRIFERISHLLISFCQSDIVDTVMKIIYSIIISYYVVYGLYNKPVLQLYKEYDFMRNIFFKKTFAVACVSALTLSAVGCGCLPHKQPVQTVVIQTQTGIFQPTTAYYPGISTIDPSETPTPPVGVELPTLKASNLSVPAGSSIDYLGNLVIESEGDTEITEIYVNTSNVRPNVPGVYNATYTVNFRGYPVSKTIVITITPPEEGSETPTYSSTLPGTPISDMVVTLLSGAQCKIPCTTEHYIFESYPDEKREEILGKMYLISVLKVVFNDGEVIELETARTRIAN